MLFEEILPIIIIAYLIIAGIGAIIMSSAAAEKGYVSTGKNFAICFFLGIFGYLYILALPDKKLQQQNENIYKALMKQSSDEYSDELPEL